MTRRTDLLGLKHIELVMKSIAELKHNYTLVIAKFKNPKT